MINLLPASEKDQLYRSLFKKQFSYFSVLISVILAGGAILVLNTYIFLRMQIKELDDSLGAEEVSDQIESAAGFEDSVRVIRGLVGKYRSFETETVSFSDVLTELERITPLGASLEIFSFEAACRQGIISGQAGDREDVLALESRLKTSNIFAKLESPLSNFLEKDKPRFSFTFYLK